MKLARFSEVLTVGSSWRRKTGPDGKRTMQDVQYLGYKSHVSVNADTGLITSLEPTGGSTPDNKQVPQLLAHELASHEVV